MKPKKSRKKIIAYVESYDDILFWLFYIDNRFNHEKNNEIFDDSILAYYENRLKWGGVQESRLTTKN